MGCVYWITGLSGSGKTSLSRLFSQRLKEENRNVIFLDGDELRSALGIEGGYSYEERKKTAFTYCRVCKMLAEKGATVVIATVSMFHVCRAWNRENIFQYHEIYLRAPMEVLVKRNQKGLFSGEIPNVVGVDVLFEEPLQPDLILENDGKSTLEEMECKLFAYFQGKGR